MAQEEKNKKVKVSNLYGRARRLELAEKVIYVVGGLLAVSFIFSAVFKVVNKVDDNQHFDYLRKHMETKGYSCERIDVTGGKCSMRNDISSYTFIRYDNGFEYLIKTKSYSLTMRHAPGKDSKINFKTTTSAFAGYKGKEYNCSFKENVINELEECIEVDDLTELDMPSYIGVINGAMRDMNELIEVSGYSKDKLLKNYEWVRVK